MRIGFVGIGLMGAPIVRHLMAAGHQLVIGSRQRTQIESFIAAGAEYRATPRDIARDVDIFLSCRVTPQQSIDTFIGPEGVIASHHDGLLCVDLATIDPATARQIGAKLGEAGMSHIDAPISGGPDGAEAKTLSIIAGGDAQAIARAEPIFALFGKKVYHMGPVGSGVATKLCNNMITITTHALVAQAMVFGVKSGIDARKLYEVLSASTASSRTLERVVPRHFLKRDFVAASTVVVVMKDLECAIDAARNLGIDLTLPKEAMKLFEETVRQGHGESDIASVILPIEESAGIRVGPA